MYIYGGNFDRSSAQKEKNLSIYIDRLADTWEFRRSRNFRCGEKLFV